jgi:CopG family nickel-responsive transcriptional regulator
MEGGMERFTVSLDDALATEFDELITQRGYGNRSEAVRDILRRFIETDRIVHSKVSHCVANVSYVYSHRERQLAQRLANLQHGQHDLTIASMHASLDHEFGIDSLLLRGELAAVRRYADLLLAERGVRHGAINVVPLESDTDRHTHGFGHKHTHTHYRPKT